MADRLPFEKLVIGEFSPAQLVTRWDGGAARRQNASIDALIAATWSRLAAAAARQGLPFPSQRLCRLVDWQVDGHTLRVTFGPTDYRELLGTNRLHPDIADRFGRDYLANAAGACSVVVTADRKLLVQRRSTSLLQFPGWYHVCGGMIEPISDGTPAVDPFVSLQTELREELGIEVASIAAMHCLGLVRDRRTLQPEFVFETRLRVPAERFARLAGPEHSELVVLDDTATELAAFMANNTARTVPVGLACLALFGRRRYGQAWYDGLASGADRARSR